MESPPDVSVPANQPGRSSQHPADPAWLSQLFDTGADFDLRQRSNLHELDRQLHRHWDLGRNMVMAWCPHNSSVLLLVVPHYAIAQYAAADRQRAAALDDDRRDFIMSLLTGPRRFSLRQIQNASKLLNTQLCEVALRSPLRGDPAEARVIDRLVRRYGVSFVPNRAVALFDIVGFSLLEPFEQMTQLNSLAHSLNSAHSRMLGNRMPVNFARSTTGDGFYIWNRDLSIEANTSLYHFMHLALADNAIARRKARGRTVPLLRAGFHVGGCYEFHQAEGLNPTIYSHIVGDATIDLARMIERAMPGQILVGDFTAALPATEQADCDLIRLDTIHFVSRAQANLVRLNGLELSGERVESIKCYLTGRARTDGTFTVRRIEISDKHGLTHKVFNAKINIYRRAAEPIFLGIEDRVLREDNVQARTVGHVVPAEVAH